MIKGQISPLPSAGSTSTPLEQWPATDRLLYERCLRDTGPYSKGGRGASWRPASRKKNVYDYGRWIAWLSKLHPELLNLNPGERVSQALVEEYRQHLATMVKPKSVACHLSGLGSMLWALCETNEFAWVQLAAQRLSRNAVGRNKRGMIPPSPELADLGCALMKEAENGICPRGFPSAVRYRNGLMIALLTYCPIRLRNLAMIDIGRHLTEHGDGYRIDFTAEDTKQKRPQSYIVPAALLPAFRRYLQIHRPVLLELEPYRGRAGNALWVGGDGDRLGASGIYKATKQFTKPRFGYDISPHRFRDAAATTIATEDPAHVRDILAVLGHASLTTSERHYNQVGSVEAARAFHRALRKLKSRSGSHRRGVGDLDTGPSK
jgi:integrase/recombinase XerD